MPTTTIHHLADLFDRWPAKYQLALGGLVLLAVFLALFAWQKWSTAMAYLRNEDRTPLDDDLPTPGQIAEAQRQQRLERFAAGVDPETGAPPRPYSAAAKQYKAQVAERADAATPQRRARLVKIQDGRKH